MGRRIASVRRWISANWLVLVILVLTGVLLVIARVTTYIGLKMAFLVALVVSVGLLSVFNQERRRWIDEHRVYASIFLVSGFLLLVAVVTSLLGLRQSVIVASLIGALIPGVYYAFTEIIKRPSVEIRSLRFADASIAPMYVFPHIARPAIFLNVEIANTGHATAENCTIKLWFEKDGEEESSYARWAIPEAEERYNLLPDETLSIHILKIFLTKDFFLLKDPDNDVIQELNNALDDADLDLSYLADRSITPQGNPSGNIRIDTSWADDVEGHTIAQVTTGDGEKEGMLYNEDIEKDDITEQICYYYPIRKPPEQSESVRGGWVGNEIEEGQYTVKLQPLAENYKKPRETLKIESSANNTLQLTAEDIATKVVEGEIDWQDQWTDKGYTDFKERVINFLEELTQPPERTSE